MFHQKQNFIFLPASYQAEEGYTAHRHARLLSLWIGCGGDGAITWRKQAADCIRLLTGIAYRGLSLLQKPLVSCSPPDIHYPDTAAATLGSPFICSIIVYSLCLLIYSAVWIGGPCKPTPGPDLKLYLLMVLACEASLHLLKHVTPWSKFPFLCLGGYATQRMTF